MGASRSPRLPLRLRRLSGCRSHAAVLLALLRDDRSPRDAHADWVRYSRGPDRSVEEGQIQREMVYPYRNVRVVLALRRYNLDLPVPLAIPNRSLRTGAELRDVRPRRTPHCP